MVSNLGEFDCPDCGKIFQTNSGLWKHSKNKHSTEAAQNETVLVSSSPKIAAYTTTDADGDNQNPPASPPPFTESEEGTLWNKWKSMEVDANTESIPLSLKIISTTGKIASKGKLTKAEQIAIDEKAVAVLKLCLSGCDSLIGVWGRTVTLDDSYTCRHSDAEKTLVAEAQLEAFKHHGIEVTQILSPTTVALALTGGYLVPPIIALSKNRKRTLIKNGGRRLLSWIPIFGKRFRHKEEETFGTGEII